MIKSSDSQSKKFSRVVPHFIQRRREPPELNGLTGRREFRPDGTARASDGIASGRPGVSGSGFVIGLRRSLRIEVTQREGALGTAPCSEPENQAWMFRPKTIVGVAEQTEMTPERWQQITGMFHAALLRNSGQRRIFLQGACGADEAMRAEVEAMLAANDNAGDAGSIPAIAVSEQMLRLQTGSVVGRYRIDALIGAGGMGQVYRARDPRIERDVAIKVLPAEYAADAERLRRFEQEAHASGALNHPNVLTLYDIGTADGRPYLVMELLDGETLRDAVSRGAIPVGRACEVAAAIARGLAAAHARGIVHRDLKPENVMVTRDGRVKILDFGIAKLRAREPDLDHPTVTTPLSTAADTMLGTASYMAPEQIRGQPTDERADLFALGAMLFELVTGRRAFDRDSRVETLNAVLHDDVPALGAIAANVPVALDRIVRRCLDKDPDARFQSARDLAFALDTVADLATSTSTAITRPPDWRRFDWRVLVAAALVLTSVAGLAIWRLLSAPVPATRQLARFTLPPPPRMRFAGVPAISPDGTLVVYPAGEGGADKRRLFVRRLDQLTSTELPGTEGASRVAFFSPDGRSVGFGADNTLKTVRVDATAAPVVVCAAKLFLGGTWTADGSIIFASIQHGLQRVSADGGAPQPLTTVNASKSEIDHHAPQILPGGRALLLTVHQGESRFRIDVLTLATGERRTIVPDGFDAEYSPTGHVVYAAEAGLFAVPFDVDRLMVTGAPVKVLDGVDTDSHDGLGRFALSSVGTLVFQPQPPPARRTLVWADHSGVMTPLPIEPRTFWTPRLSPDGRQFAVVITERGRRNIWVYRFDNATFTPVTSEGLNREPVWTRDGLRLAYLSERDGVRHLMSQPSDSSAAAESLLTSQNDDLIPASWSADGRSLVYVDSPPTDNSEIHVLQIEGRHVTALAGIPAYSNRPTLSPDGRWLAFGGPAFETSGRPVVYIRPFAGPGQSRQLVDDAGQPVWSRDGGKLFFRSRRGASPVSPGDGIFELPFDRARGLAAGPERQLFRQALADDLSWGVAGYDVAPDGRFLLVISDESESVPADLNVLLHVDDELRRRVR
jgi:eukaryotic-like serine/threonine-protein kinase